MKVLYAQWVCGFVDGEGTFYVGINKHSGMKAGYQVLPEFRIVQHKKDLQLLYKIRDFFGSGVVRVNHDDRYELRIRSFQDICSRVLPFFEEHELQTQKSQDFILFTKVIRMMESKKHLSKDGIAEIIRISKKMNRKHKPYAEIILSDIESEEG